MYINIVKSNLCYIVYLVGEKMENQNNPLKSYFRKPGIWVKLPSQGHFYNVRPTDLNDTGEIPVYPMTAKDELMLKNADALLNGNAIVELIRSCAPAIQDPENMPSIDLDVVLLAIRRSTYGGNMDITTNHDCKDDASNEVSLNLDALMTTIKIIEDIEPVTLSNEIKVYIKPVTVKQLLNLNWVQYEQVRNIQLAEQDNVDEKTRVDMLQKSYYALTSQNIKIVSECIETVLLPDGISVSDQTNIKEWATDLSKSDFKLVETAIMGLGNKGVDKTFKVQCRHCEKEYDSQLDLNPTTFFE
jgi:hypothetical protein